MRLRSGQDWVRSELVYTDFEFGFEYRALDPAVEALVAVRVQRRDSRALEGNVFRISSVRAFPDWRRVAVRAEAARITLTVDGHSSTLEDDGRFAGFVLLRVAGGAAEVRNVSMHRLLRPRQPSTGVMTSAELAAQGGTSPRLVREVKPNYTRAALTALIEGEVHMEAVVLADGSVGDVHVFRSLHPELDQEAVTTVKQWRFAPATLNGAAISMLVEVHMTFTLK